MTDKTQPEALRLANNIHCGDSACKCSLNLAAAELLRQHARIAELEAALFAYASEFEPNGDGGVQALSAAPAEQRAQPGAVYAELPHSVGEHKYGGGLFTEAQMRDFADRTHALRMQAAPKAAPGELHDHQILAITTAYEQGVGKGRQAYSSGKEIANPYITGYRCDLAWQYGYKEGKEQAERIAKAAPKPAPAPLSDDTKRLAWMADEWTPGHEKLYDKHVLETGGVGGLDDLRTFIDKQIAAQGGKV